MAFQLYLHTILTFFVSVITLIGTIFVVLSLGEIASIYPTAGGKTCCPRVFPLSPLFLWHIHQMLLLTSLSNLGQYHWVHCLSPPSYRATASWFTGWISIGGQLVFAASAAFASGLQLQGLITLNNLDTYIPQRWQGMLFYWLVLAYSTALNIFGSKILPHTNTAAGECNIRGLPRITN